VEHDVVLIALDVADQLDGTIEPGLPLAGRL